MGAPLPPDSPDTYEADLEAMRRDAGVWDGAAERMSAAHASAQQLALSGHDLSLISQHTRLDVAYQEIHQWAVGLLQGAHTNLAGMANALRESAAAYEAEEASAARSFDELNRGEN